MSSTDALDENWESSTSDSRKKRRCLNPHKQDNTTPKKSKPEAKTRCTIPSLGPAQQATYLNEKISSLKSGKHFSCTFSIQDSYVFDMTSVDESLKQHDIGKLEELIKALLPDWSEKLDKRNISQCGSPIILLITESAIKAVDIIRALPSLKTIGCIQKLFAKHFKIEEQISLLNNSVLTLGVATPNRAIKLIEAGALKLELCELVLFDVAPDEKKRSLFESKDIAHDSITLITDWIAPLLSSGSLRIALC